MADERPASRDPRRTLELLWGRTTRPSRGPKPSLSLAGIVRVAVAIADAEGMRAVSMRRVADDLGVTTMSLYRYVPGKDDLVELMMESAVGLPPERDGGGPGHWRRDLERWARAQHVLYRRRPWMLQVPIHGPPMGPNNLAWMDSALQALFEPGLSEGDALYGLLLLSVYVRGEAQLGLGLAQAEQRTGVTQLERDMVYGGLIASLRDDPRYPALARLAESGIFEEGDDEPDADFDFGLQRILDGIETLIRERGSPTLAR
ncbi:MAG: TetR/AcrR family transcriptional regulator [Jiangellaceae bacterium]